jgi:hypothetical protein
MHKKTKINQKMESTMESGIMIVKNNTSDKLLEMVVPKNAKYERFHLYLVIFCYMGSTRP